jgi:hypothetical protein
VRNQKTYLRFTIILSILLGIILPFALGGKDPTLIAIFLSSFWFVYAALLFIITFLIKPGLKIRASRQNGVTVVRYELRNPEPKDAKSQR